MAADVSRVRFDALRDHSAVGLQQGRLLLDGDFNEQVDITDRRLRAQVVDAYGVAVVSGQSPDAFRITAAAGDLTIGAGRLYVDGLLAENHGDPAKLAFDPVLAELSSPDPVAYADQPYWPVPDALPTSPGPHLAYLDVWRREVTPLVAPDLVEPAVGVDTTTRAQTVWQVRLIEGVGTGATCGGKIAAWDELTAPSGARLTTGTVPVDPADDPCELPPTGGYRGPENHTYRVEMHDATTWKWSRDNASVASAVVEVVADTKLRLASLGRDSVLRFSEDDWVEVTDDRRELGRQPGVMRRISVDDATSTVTFTPALPTDLVPSGVGGDTAAARHLRVIRWDQRGKVLDSTGANVVDLDATGTGLVPLKAGQEVVLEHGLTVKLSFPDGGKARPGDHWVFVARSTDASYQKLDAAPPLGVHHHYVRLALVTFPGKAEDCRPAEPAPAEGCGCEVCVTPEGHTSGALTVQAAVDAVQAAGGGTVVLCPGTYPLSEPVRLHEARSVTLRGAGPASRLVAEGTAVVVSLGVDVASERLGVLAGGDGPAVALLGGWGCRVEEVSIAAAAPQAGGGKRAAIGLGGVQVLAAVRRCTLAAPTGVGIVAGSGSPAAGAAELPAGLLTAGLRIEENLIQCARRGVDLTGLCLHMGEVRIDQNMIFGTAEAAVAATGLTVRADVPVVGVLTVAGNNVRTEGGIGILTGGRAVVVDNEVTAARRGAQDHGILVAAEPPGAEPGTVQVVGNRVTGVGGLGIVVEAPAASLLVKQNVVAGCGGGVVVRGPGPKDHVSIDNNHVLDVVPASADDEPTVGIRPGLADGVPGTATGALARGVLLGVSVTAVGQAHLAGNLVDGVGVDAAEVAGRLGVVVVLADDVRVSGNVVSRLGEGTAEDGSCIGIGVASATRSVAVEANTVHSGESSVPVHRPRWRALVVTDAQSDAAPTRVVRAGALGTVTLDGSWVYVKAAADAGPPLQMAGNTLHGGGENVAVAIDSAGDAVLHGNWLAQPPDSDEPALELAAATAVVQGNRALGGRPSMRLAVDPDRAAVIGNMTSGDITVGGTPVRQTGKAWSQLNPVVS
ncbi:MAG TPA: DUF6519 domain-containing protein [Micromonosporaceae bacterium]|nr:DUF6519 domain-containing protein [Micromonosporaceae bacterium]